MDSGDLSTDLSLGILTPTASVRPVDSHPPQEDAEGKSRRRSQPENAAPESDDTIPGGSDDPHQIDRLA
jgi:hypothetical protein